MPDRCSDASCTVKDTCEASLAVDNDEIQECSWHAAGMEINLSEIGVADLEAWAWMDWN
jgi:hypothetical protein